MTLVLFSLCSCAGGKDTAMSFEQEPPFTLGAAYYQDWVAGVQEGGSGTNVHITIEDIMEDVEILHIYFGNKKEKAQNTGQNIDQYIGYFKNKTRPDVIMDGDALKEAQNTAPEATPFKLGDGDAVLSYRHDSELKYVMLSQMERKPMIAYPGVNKNDEEH